MRSHSVDKNRKVRLWAYSISFLLHLIFLPFISQLNLEGRRKFVGLIAEETSYVRPIYPVLDVVDQVPLKTKVSVVENDKPTLESTQVKLAKPSTPRPKPTFATNTSLDSTPVFSERKRLLTNQRFDYQITEKSIQLDGPPIQSDEFLVKQSAQEKQKIRFTQQGMTNDKSKFEQFHSNAYRPITSDIETRELWSNSPQLPAERGLNTSQKGRLINGAVSGGGQSSGSAFVASSPANDYPSLMRNLAAGLVNQVSAKKVDLVFILDRTASMTDNIRAIRAYVGKFLDQFQLAKRDVGLGLVSFSDRQHIRFNGVTTRFRKFNKWMHKIQIEGGGDLAESGLDAIMVALDNIKFRRTAQTIFVFVTDGTFHDLDYDGQSTYSLDQVIANLKERRVRVEVIGIDYLPVKQLALATGGNWHSIPGRGYMESVDLTNKTISKLGVIGEEIIIYINTKPRPKWVEIRTKLLSPLGEKIPLQISHQRIEVPNDGSATIDFKPEINIDQLAIQSGIYIAIYRLLNSHGQQSILRQMIQR